jgi:hypothetical protein
VTEYGVARYVGYSQTSDDPPSTPESWTLIAIVVTDTPDAMLSASVSFDVPPPVSFEMNVANAYIRQYLGSYFPDEAAFLLAYPETTYTVTVDLGAGPVSGDVFVPADLYCPEIPALTGDTFDRLQAHDTSRAFDGTINGFTLAPGTSEGSSTVTVIQIGEPTTAWSANLQPGDTEFQIPAGVLLPGTNYSIGISYFNVALTSNAGFGAATARTEYFRGTGALFATLPFPPACAADFNADGAVNSQDFFDFLAAFFAGTPSADFNHDGVVNSQDFFELLTALFAGC